MKNLTVRVLASTALLVATAMSHRMHPLSDKFIDFINSKQTLWKAGRNFHRDTPLKYLKRLIGTIKVSSTHSDAFAGKPPRYKHTSLSKEFDARNEWKAWCNVTLNDIRDQGSCGSCWAVSAVSAMSDRLCIQSKGRENHYFSELDVMSCCMNCGSPCAGGILEKAWSYGKRTGIVSGGKFHSQQGCKPYTIAPCEHNMYHSNRSSHCNYFVSNTVCDSKCEPSYKKKYLKDKRKLAVYYKNTNVRKIMLDIQNEGPVTTSFLVYEDFLTYKGGIYSYVTGKKLGYHSVKLLGWGEERGTQYWLVANSWNTDWGDKGFFKILRGNNHLGIEHEVYAGLFTTHRKKH